MIKPAFNQCSISGELIEGQVLVWVCDQMSTGDIEYESEQQARLILVDINLAAIRTEEPGSGFFQCGLYGDSRH